MMALQKLFLLSLSLLICCSNYLLILPCNGDLDVASGRINVETTSKGNSPRPRPLLTGRKAAARHALAETSSDLKAKVVNVKSYGAKGDGSTDATQKFAAAWKVACSSSVPAIFLVPKGGTFLLKPITFSGSCKSSITVRIQGNLLASPKRSDWNGKDLKEWIEFNSVHHLHVEGGGTIDGNGKVWWRKSCKVDKSQRCTAAPTAVTFDSCNNLLVENLKIKNSQKMQVSFEECNNVVVSGLSITAPSSSPNTDGIHVTKTKNIQIKDCVIATGDDCISIVSGSQGVTATNIKCSAGHGISIGSLGKDNSKAYVSDVLIDNVKLSGTTNGARIKTWQGGQGYAKDITFRNIDMSNVKNPIIIDQYYCDSSTPCKQKSSAVAVSNVKYESIKGTSASSISINFDCSKTSPCQGITLKDIKLVKGDGKATKSFCNNVKLSKTSNVVPKPCA